MPRRAGPRNDHDAGGSADLLDRKAALREKVWAALSSAGVARFPGADGRIPNFTGAAAAGRLRGTDAWQAAGTLKANPDSPQWPVRQRALEDGKIALEELEPVDLVVAGCVAAGEDGARLGKGGGFSDLEFALATEAGLIGPSTVVVTTVHELQVRPAGVIPTTGHDVTLDLIVTPERVIVCRNRGRRTPARLAWEELTEEKIEAIPLLARWRRLSPERRARR